MIKELFNSGWSFVEEKRTFKKFSPSSFSFPQKKLTPIFIPDDRSIIKKFNDKSKGKNEAGLLDGGIFWYVKRFNITSSDLEKEIFINFEGVYMNSSVYINENKIGTHPNGYTPVIYNITNHLKVGENLIAVRVENIQPSSRWYSGTGIYRDVYLIKTSKIFIPIYGVMVKTPRLKQTSQSNNIRCDFNIDIKNNDEESKDFKIKLSLLDSNKNILKEEHLDKKYKINSKTSLNINETIYVSDIKLWDPDNPNIYYFRVELLNLDGNTFFKKDIRYGFRYFNYSQDGFFINGKYLKIKGVCEHHDHGILGSKSYDEAIMRKIKILKDMGVNAIRSAHNMACSKLIYHADTMGMLIMDEAFDCWYESKKEYDYGRFFEKKSDHPEANGLTNAEFDLMTMINRDKNAPSVFAYSIGNEIELTHNPSEKAIKVAKTLVDVIKQIDTTRPITLGQNGYERDYDCNIHKISSYLDIVGLNYSEKNFEKIKKEKPNFILLGTETSSAVKSRGVYIDPKGEYDNNISVLKARDKRDKYTLSAYGNDRVAWGLTANDVLLFEENNKDYLGQFVWTGFDYIGEPTPWHNTYKTLPKSSFFGIIDTIGLPKDDYFLYKSIWQKEGKPFCHILPHWNFTESDLKLQKKYGVIINPEKIPLRVYTNMSAAEVFINNQSYGRLTFDKKKVDGNIVKTKNGLLFLEWIVPYNKDAILKVITYDDKAKPVLTKEIKRIDDPVSIDLIKDPNSFSGKNNLHYYYFVAKDQNDNINPIADNLVKFELIGDGVIVGTDNGNPGNRVPYQVNSNKASNALFMGYGLIIVRKNSNSKVKLIAKSKKLKTKEIIF